jgi:hypothetical protein
MAPSVEPALPRLTYRSLAKLLTGLVAGKPIHSLVQVGSASPGALPPGRYRIHQPVEHPSLGRVAVITAQDAVTYTIGGSWSAPNVLGKVGTTAGSSPAANVTTDAWPRVAGAALSYQGWMLTKAPMAGSNALVVTTGFNELMDALVASGGALLEVTT